MISSPLTATTPELLIPGELTVKWTEPTEQRDGPRVPIKDYYLVFRKETTLPIGSYGLDSATSRPRSKQLPTSNALALQSDIKIKITDTGDRRAKEATIKVSDLQKEGVLSNTPTDAPLWKPESWRIFIQTVSTKDVPSPLSPVQLVLQVKKAGAEAFEERRPAELEWLPKPIRMAMLPPERPTLSHVSRG